MYKVSSNVKKKSRKEQIQRKYTQWIDSGRVVKFLSLIHQLHLIHDADGARVFVSGHRLVHVKCPLNPHQRFCIISFMRKVQSYVVHGIEDGGVIFSGRPLKALEWPPEEHPGFSIVP